MQHAAPSPASGTDSSRASGIALGATLAVVLGIVGLVLPFVSVAAKGVLEGVGAALPPPTSAVVGLSPWAIVLGAVVLAGVLVMKERLMPRRAALAANVATLVVTTVLAAAALAAVVLPLISMGQSLAGG